MQSRRHKDFVSSDTLMDQAPDTVLSYFEALQQKLPEGYAERHPEAFARLVQACVLDFAACEISTSLQALTAAVDAMD
jgi:hypothetical protein